MQKDDVEEKQKWMRMNEIGAERKRKGRPCTCKLLKDDSEREKKKRERFLQMCKALTCNIK